MEITIGNCGDPLVWFQIGRFFSTRRVAVEGTPTGRQASPCASPLCQKRLRAEQESQSDNQIIESKLTLWRERNIGRQKSPLFLYVTEEWALSEKCQTKPNESSDNTSHKLSGSGPLRDSAGGFRREYCLFRSATTYSPGWECVRAP
jgi:hypothetical protein